ncbi:unnamed protein product [Discula destructiva]
MDPGTILAIVSLIVQVVGGVDKVIQSFDRMQNAPRELRDFSYSIKRLDRKFKDFQKDVEASSNILHSEDIEQIDETLTLCAALFRKHEERQREGVVNVVLRSMWSSGNNEKLAKYKARIDEHYSTILVPGWVQLLVRAKSEETQGEAAVLDGNAARTQISGPERLATLTLVPESQLQQIAQLIEDLKDVRDTELVEQKLRQLDAEVQRFRIQLGLPNQDDEAWNTFQNPFQSPNPRRRSSLAYEAAPTKLYLNNAPEKHRELKLERVHILARDDDTRILQYQSRDASINVTHIVPYGSIPWTPEKDSRRVSFLKAHVITVSDQEGYHNYHIDPKYKFESLDACRKFQSTLRERDLCEAFDAVEITEASTIVARRQVIRLWQRRRLNEMTIATMTFFPSSIEGRKHREINLADYSATIKSHSPMFRRQNESDAVDLLPSMTARRSTKKIRVKFESTTAEAQFFKNRFHALHPSNVPPTLSLPPEKLSTRMSLEPPLDGKFEPAPPSLYPDSLCTETSLCTAAPTPSDNDWNLGGPPSIKKWSLDGGDDQLLKWKSISSFLQDFEQDDGQG